MQNNAKRILQCGVILVGIIWECNAVRASQTISSSPDPSAGVQYVAPICPGGTPCTMLNDGLSAGSAKWDSDVGKAIDDAYAALPPTGGVIYVLSLGGCSDFSTPIDLRTQWKYVRIVGTGGASTCLNYTPSTGTAITLATGNGGIGYDLLKNFSLRTAAEGSSANGLVIGSNGVSAPYTTLDGISISGFRDDLIDDSYGVVLTNTGLFSCSSAADSVAFQTGASGSQYGDDTRIHASTFSGCATLLAIGNENPVWADGLVLANASSTWVDVPHGALFCDRCHWFNQSGTAHWFNTGANLIVTNSQFEDASSTGTSTSYARETGGFTIIINSVLFSAGHSVTEFLNATAGNAFLSNFANTTPQLIPKLSNGIYSGTHSQAAVEGAGGISAGTCTISGGQCSHTFAEPYFSAPICTATLNSAFQISSPPAVSDSSTSVTVTDTGALDGALMNWMCYPAAN
ncbi:MAG TPA: hypothetical protein VFE02_20335 [Candidatus Acidoferrales bacterium]|nr:hypothetical protein [Candidatus Acidoferrales bacterium]